MRAEKHATFFMSRMLMAGGKFKDALPWCEKAVELGPTDAFCAPAWKWLALVSMRLHGPDAGIEVCHRGVVRFPQRIQPGSLVTTNTVGGDQLDDAGFLVVRGRGAAGRCQRGQAAQLPELLLHGQVAAVGRAAVAQGFEQGGPLPGHAVRIFQPILVTSFYPGGVAGGKMRRAVQLFQGAFHVSGGIRFLAWPLIQS